MVQDDCWKSRVPRSPYWSWVIVHRDRNSDTNHQPEAALQLHSTSIGRLTPAANNAVWNHHIDARSIRSFALVNSAGADTVRTPCRLTEILRQVAGMARRSPLHPYHQGRAADHGVIIDQQSQHNSIWMRQIKFRFINRSTSQSNDFT
jgi:hypothetical protein